MTNDFLSIIVPTSSGRIPWSLLHSIKEQSLDSNNYDIVLVFNKKKPPANVIPWPNVRFLFSPIAGVNHARNLGLLHAKGNILLFLDDDCTLQNKNYLSLLVDLHRQHPEQKSIGGPYMTSSTASAAARAYHWNRNHWLQSHRLGQWHSQVLLGGNASYKKMVFENGLRFSPGITYGGSETPLNLEICQKYGPHLFLDSLSVEHASQLSVMSLLQKAYMQGKGWAFQKKFHQNAVSQTPSRETSKDLITSLLLYFYNILFMMGYRTSIFERRFWWRSAAEELALRIFAPLFNFWNDLSLARIVSTNEYFPYLPASPRLQINTVHEHESLFSKLQSTPKHELETASFTIDTRNRPDSVFLDLLKISNFYSIVPEQLSFSAYEKQEPALLIHFLSQGVVVFDPALSDHYKTWNKQRLELSKIKTSIYYLSSPDTSVVRHAWPHKKQTVFYPLDNVFIDKTIWDSYLKGQPPLHNHFSWTQFLLKNPMRVDFNFTKVGLQIKMDTLCDHAKVYFLSSPQRAFYQQNYVLLGNGWKTRSQLLRWSTQIQKNLNWIPHDWKQFVKATMLKLHQRATHWNIEAQETSSLVYKWTAYALHRLYWMSHRLFWISSEVYWFFYKAITYAGSQIIWRTFDALVFLYLILNSIFWFLHAHIFGPTIGFFRSLAEEPEHIKNLPAPQRYKQRMILVAKKWGWLFLRGVRLR